MPKTSVFCTADSETHVGINGTKQILMGLVLAVAVMFPRFDATAGQAPVDLRSTANFAILAGATVTSTGGGMINGDVGASPIAGSAIGVTCAQVNGIIYAVDAAGPACAVIDPTLLTTAKGDLTIAYNDAAGRTPVPTGPFLNPNGGNIGGLNLAPGLYKFTTTAYLTGSDVTLTGGPDDVWIFQCAQDFEVGVGRTVILAGGAQAKNIFWQVGTSATVGTTAIFKGTIMAQLSIALQTGATLHGRALAQIGAVTLEANTTTIPSLPEPPRFGPVYRAPNGSVTLVITNTPGLALTLQTSANLTSWTTLATPTPAVSPDTFTDTTASAESKRFYRAFYP